MNKTTGIIGGIVAVVVIAGIAYYAVQNTNQTPSSTPPPDATNTNTNPPAQAEKSGLPVVITGPTAAPYDTTVVLTGTVNPNGALTNHWYEFGTTASLGNISSKQSVGSGYTAFSAPIYITGLTKDTTYYYQLVAENQNGKVVGTQYTFQTSHGIPAPVGSAPTAQTLAAAGVSRVGATLNGQVVPNKAMTQFWFEYGKTANFGNTTTLQSVGSGSSALAASATLSGLDPDTTYSFRLNAQNQFGTVNGASLTFKTAGPSAGTAPSATTRNDSAVSTSTATLAGTVNPNGAETKYWFEYSTDSLFGSASLHTTGQVSAGAGTSPVSVETDVSSLSKSMTYYFRIVAQNSVGITRGDSQSFKTKN